MRTVTVRSCRVSCAAALLSATMLAPASAQQFTQFFAFGDSSVDSGWWKTAEAANNATGNVNKDNLIKNSIALGGTGAPVGAGYLEITQVLSAYFGLTAVPANQSGGTSYAISGALTAAVPANGNAGNANNNTSLPSTVQQVANYLSSVGSQANPNGLYVFGTGGNDITYAQDNIAGLANREAYLASQASVLAAELRVLQDAGARYILVHANSGSGTLGVFWTQSVWSSAMAAGVNIIPSDIRAMRVAVQSNPGAFGYTAATVQVGTPDASSGSACLVQTGGGGPQTGWGQWCVNSTTPSSQHAYLRSADAQQTSFYSDDQHFSASGQKIEADYDYSLIVAPSEISYLAEAPVKTRAGVISAILNQIPLSQGQPGTFHSWVTGDLSWLKMTNGNTGFPDDPGTPVAVTAGFDFRMAPSWLLGVAFSGGTTRQTFSLGGDFKESEFAISLYSAHEIGPIWANFIGSAGRLDYDVNRQVPIGITVQSNTGSTHGSNFSFAAETGYNFMMALGSRSAAAMPAKAPAVPLYLKHGPLVGIVLQRVRVDGYTETDQFAAVGGFTALSFGNQTRNSAVTEVGYQASLDFGRWQPFAKLAWNHELEDGERLVQASLTTDPLAPSYSLPAVELGRDWGTAVAGTRFKFGPDIAGYAAFIGQIGQDHAASYGGQVGINVAFNPGPLAARY